MLVEYSTLLSATPAVARADRKRGSAMAAGAVCIVEDDESVRDSMTTLLEAHHFVVAAYPSGTAFFADERRLPISCLIIDQHMPGLDGLEVVAALQRAGRVPPTILITGRPDAAIDRRAGELGVYRVLQKRFGMGQLVELIDSMLAAQG